MKIVEVNVITGARTERDPTSEELAALPTASELKSMEATAIQSTIDALEGASLMNRGTRELNLRLMEWFAAQTGEDLATVPAYIKFKALDDQITQLREQIWALS